MLLAATSCRQSYVMTSDSNNQYIVSEKSVSSIDSVLYNAIKPFRDSLATGMNVILGYSMHSMVKGRPESELGNFCVDACMRQALLLCEKQKVKPPDVCIINNGGLRASLPKGAITVGNVFELMPFDNELIIVTVDSAGFDSLLNHIIKKGGEPVSQLQLIIKEQKIAEAYIKGQPVSNYRSIRVLTSDYLANGGDAYPALKSSIDRHLLGIRVRDVISNEIQHVNSLGDSIKSAKDGRIQIL